MRIAMVGLGRMGANMARRLIQGGHEVVVTDPSAAAVDGLVTEGAIGSASLADAIAQLPSPKVVWVMVPSGHVTEAVLGEAGGLLGQGDVLIDGGNSPYKDAQRWSAQLAKHGIAFLDAGTSGGVWGLTEGYCLMVGGSPDGVAIAAPIFTTLAPAVAVGWRHVGVSGAGHFVKMVHNGIEYGLMQAYGEGFALLDAATELGLGEDGLAIGEIAELWRNGSVVRSWLLDLTALALADTAGFAQIEGQVDDSGEGRWTAQEAIERGVPAPVMTASLYERFASRDPNLYSNRLLAAMRNQFGGHALHKADS